MGFSRVHASDVPLFQVLFDDLFPRLVERVKMLKKFTQSLGTVIFRKLDFHSC